MRSRSLRSIQAGSVLLFSLVALLLIYLGVLFALRGGLNDSGLTDHFAQRQGAVQGSDLALQSIITNTLAKYTAPLEVSANSQAWFFNAPAGHLVNAGDVAAYFCQCITKSASCGWNDTSTTPTCPSTPLTLASGQTAYFFVQPTYMNSPGGEPYDIWIRTIDARNQVSTDVEALFLPQ